MTKIYVKEKRLSYLFKSTLFVLALFVSGQTFAQLSGTYTVDSSAASSLTTKNFQSFTDLADSLDTYGVSGAVTVNVVAASGPYNEQVTFGTISGASSTNTITINGNGETLGTNQGAVIDLDGTDYLTIDNLHILVSGTGSSARGVWIHGGADYNTISNCDIEFSAYTGTSNSTGYVVFSSSATSHSQSSHGRWNTISDNYMHGTSNSYGPYYGVTVYGNSGAGNMGNTISGNDIRDVYYYYVYAYYANDLQVTNNDLHHQRNGTSYTYAVYAYYCDAVNRNMSFDNNLMHNFTANYFYGTYFYYCDGLNNYKVTQNNNQIYSNNNSSYHYGYRVGRSTNVEIIDNVITNSRSGGYFYYAIYNYYNNDAIISGNEITNNTAGTYFYYPSYHYYSNDVVFSDNLISGNTAGSYFYYAMYYMYYCNNMEFDHNEVSNNSAAYYFYCSYNYQGSNVHITRNKLSGNTAGYYVYYGYMTQYISNGSLVNNIYCNNQGDYGNLYCIYNAYCDNYTIAHNTLDINYDMDYYYYGMYIYYYNTPVNVKIHNNIMTINANPGFGYGYPIYCYYNTDEIDWANNVYNVIQPGTQYWYANSTSQGNAANFMTAADDNTSKIADPQYVNRSGCNLTPQNPAISNMGTQGLAAIDYNADTRTACGPDPGAYEFFVDHNVSNLVFTGTNECGNYSEPISIDFNNGTSVAMQDVSMFYTINGANKVTETIDNVAGSSSETHTFDAVPVFNTPGVNTIAVGLGCDDDESNNILTHDITITPSPSGGDLVQGATFDGYFNAGSMGNPDIAVPNTTSVYDIVAPTKYQSTGSYGVDWTITDNSMTSGGMSTSGLGVDLNTTAMTFTVDPDPSLTDSMVYVSFVISDLNTGCDSTVGRWLYVPFTPEVNFNVNAVCLGDLARFKNTSTMGGDDFMLYKWRYGDPNSTEDSSESKDGFWEYSTYGNFDVTLEVVNESYPKFVYTLTQQVTITPTPVTDFAVINACEGVDIQFDNRSSISTGTMTYVWNFGDGSATSTAEDPTHQYATPLPQGYQVTLTATANGCTSSKTKTAYQFARPVADFTTNGACNLEEIEFTNKTSLAIGKSGYTWDFGDNGISTVTNPTHVYSDPGTHTITLTAYSEFGCEDDVTIDITLLESPEADFTVDATCNLTPVNFTRTGSVPNGIASDFTWDFNGEGVSYDENPSHLFSEVGKKEVTLTVSSLNGCSSTITKDLNVVLQAKADFEAGDYSFCEGEEVPFTNKSSVAAGDLTYTWLLGAEDEDGNTTSSFTNPSPIYKTTGVTRIVNVTLIAEVDGGCDAQITKPITLNAAPDADFTPDVQGRTVVFDAPSGYNIYAWRFGNGASSSDEDPIYTYSNVDKGTFEVCLDVKNDECWNGSCEMVTINLVGIEDLENKDAMINVYPNPSTGVFNLSVENPGDNIEIAVSDVLGNVLPINITDKLDGNYVIDLSNVADGVYFVQVKNGNFYSTKKITVSK